MGIGEDIKQKSFKSEHSKALINVLYTNAWIAEKHQKLFKSLDLSTPQYNVLRILRGQYPNPATVNLIIERMLDKNSNASRIVDKLELKGLVMRRKCQNDKRAVDVLISQEGLNILSEMDPSLDSMESQLCNLSDEEAIQLNKLLDKMRSKVS